MPPNVISALGLGLGLFQTISGQQAQNRAIEAASHRLSPEQIAAARTQGTSNIKSAYAQRGLSDSSLVGGALGNLETGIAEAASGQGDMANLLSQQAMGLTQSGGNILGSLADIYLYNKLLKGQNVSQPGATGSPGYASNYDYGPTYPSGQTPVSNEFGTIPPWWLNPAVGLTGG